MRSRKNYADWSYQARTNRVKIVGCPNAENRKRHKEETKKKKKRIKKKNFFFIKKKRSAYAYA